MCEIYPVSIHPEEEDTSSGLFILRKRQIGYFNFGFVQCGNSPPLNPGNDPESRHKLLLVMSGDVVRTC